MEEIYEREHSSLERCLETGDIRFKIGGDSFEQRTREYRQGDSSYQCVIRIHDIQCRIYASLHFPGLPVLDGSEDDVRAHDSLIERAAISYGKDEVLDVLDLKSVERSGRQYRVYGTDIVMSRLADTDFFKKRADMVGLSDLASEMVDRRKGKLVRVLESGLFMVGVGATGSSLPLGLSGSPVLGGLACVSGIGIAVSLSQMDRYRQEKTLMKLLRGADIFDELKVMQDVHEDDSKREMNRHNFHVYFQELSWNLRHYQKGLSFILMGQRDEVEERISTLLGDIPARRMKYQSEIEHERKRREEELARSFKDARMGKTCGYCRREFVMGDVKVQGELFTSFGAGDVSTCADFHQACFEEYQEIREAPVAREGVKKERA